MADSSSPPEAAAHDNKAGGGPTITSSLLPKPASDIHLFLYLFCAKALTQQQSPGRPLFSLWSNHGRQSGLIGIMSMHVQRSDTHALPLCFEENKHVGETLSILFISLAQICWGGEQTNISADSKARLRRTELIRPVLLAQGLPVFFFS